MSWVHFFFVQYQHKKLLNQHPIYCIIVITTSIKIILIADNLSIIFSITDQLFGPKPKDVHSTVM